MNFTEETNKAISKVITDQLPGLIEKRASAMIEDIVKDIFSWGDIQKSIKKKIEASINVNLQEFDLIDYNALIAKTINENLVQQINLQPILDMTQKIIGFSNKKEIKLYEIANLFIEAAKEDYNSESEGEITFIVEENEKYSWVEISADINADKEKHQCSVRFIISNEGDSTGKIFSFKTKEEYFETKQKEISPSRLTALRGIEAEIFRIYSGQVRVTDFTEEVETYWTKYD